MGNFMRTLAVLMFFAAAAAQAAGLAGIWSGSVDGEALVLQLGADGNGTLNGGPIRYQVLGQQLLIQNGDELNSYGFELKGDSLHVSGGDLEAPVTLRRGKAAAQAKPGKLPAGPVAQGGPAQELAGKWCWITNFNANLGGGSQTSRCFELRADGNYVYDGESSISAYSEGNSGLYGGTASSSHDEGRWSLSGGALVAQSSSGSVTRYRLEKRNHPKNHDPMICLDGDCFVTYWKKSPW